VKRGLVQGVGARVGAGLTVGGGGGPQNKGFGKE